MSGKKRRKSSAPEGAPEWMVTFGDLMSLLLTFFILLFSISEVKQQKIYELFRSFRTHFEVSAPSMGFHVEQLSDVLNMLSELALDLPDQKTGKEGKTRIEVENPFGQNAEVVRVKDNLTISISGRVLFSEHSANLTDEGREILTEIRDRLRGMTNWIKITGHANPSLLPPGGEIRDHDDLGYLRAKATKEFLASATEEQPGIRPERMELSTRGRNDRLPGVSLLEESERRRLDRVDIQVTPEPALEPNSI